MRKLRLKNREITRNTALETTETEKRGTSQELCIEHNIGLTKLYNQMDDGAFVDLAALHKALDTAVVEAYGWPRAVAQDGPELVRRLTERNREIIEGERAYDPFGYSNMLS